MQYDDIVIGGGLGGLASALFLARGGRRVAVLERASAVGGRAQTRRRQGYAFNFGPHALYRHGAAMAVFRELGIEPRGIVPSAGGRLRLDGRDHALPGGAWSLLTTSAFDWRARFEIGRLFPTLPRLRPQSFAGQSATAVIESLLERSQARAFLATLFRLTTYCSDLGTLDGAAALDQLQRGLRGVLYIDDGWQTLCDALASAARAAGVTIMTQTPVESVERGPAGIVVHVRDAATIETTGAILAVPPEVVRTIAPSVELPSNLHEVRLASLDVALCDAPQGPALVLDADQALYYSVHSRARGIAPASAGLVTAAAYLHADDPRSPEAIRAQLEAFVDSIEPRWRERAVAVQFLPQMTVTPGAPTVESGGLPGRPPGPTNIEELHLVGDWVGPTGQLVDASLASARAAALALLGRKVMQEAA